MPNIDSEVSSLANLLWNYHNVPNNAAPADIVLALGSSDIRVAHEAASLLLRGLAPILVVSGGIGKVTAHDGGESEAVRFARVAREMGVPEDQLLLEPTAVNTGENFTKTKMLLESRQITPRDGIFVTKPYMKRRALATALVQWPQVNWIPHSPSTSFEDYPDENVSQEQMIQLMVGDLQRIAIYPKMGYQVEQPIPANVWAAYQRLVALGFDKYVIRE